MEAGALAQSEDLSPFERWREAMRDRPALVTLGFVGLVGVLLIVFEGLQAVADTALTGLSTGSIYALGAVGLTLVYGILKLVNFAHGDFLTFGAYMAYILSGSEQLGVPLVVGILFAMAMTALLGVALEKGMWAPMRRRGAGMLQLLLMSIGLALVIRYAIQYIWGTELRGATTQLQPEMGFELLLPIFAVVVLGGIGDAFGALTAGILLGVVIEWSTLVVDERWKTAIGFVVLILVLIIRPQGIFGKARAI